MEMLIPQSHRNRWPDASAIERFCPPIVINVILEQAVSETPSCAVKSAHLGISPLPGSKLARSPGFVP